MGLTGLITWRSIQLERVPSGWVDAEAIRFRSLEGAETLDDESRDTHSHTVAWISTGSPAAGRSGAASTSGEPRPGALEAAARPKPRNVTFEAPDFLLSPFLLRTFNAFYDHLPRLRSRSSVWKFFSIRWTRGSLEPSLPGGPASSSTSRWCRTWKGAWRVLLALTSTRRAQGLFLSVLKRFVC